MQSIRRRFSIILIVCSAISVLLSALFVNMTISSTFNRYMEDIQAKRDLRLIEYFEQIYIKDGKWNEKSGEEMMHEAYMGNYCLTLLDENKNILWQMNPNDIKFKGHIMLNGQQEEGVYTEHTFEINVNDKAVGYLIIGQYSPVLLSKEDVGFKTNINKSIIVSVIFTTAAISVISLFISKQFSSPIKAVSETSVSL